MQIKNVFLKPWEAIYQRQCAKDENMSTIAMWWKLGMLGLPFLGVVSFYWPLPLYWICSSGCDIDGVF